ncbi:retrovirus-related Pol polyprotein from transposon 412 [Trichonephila clavipes]|nr:retrovirus-related Pol polyprotein from transposon 412 [Trichonephila clavipes]
MNHGQVTWTTPELAPPLLTTTPHEREDVSALDRFNVHRCPIRRVFSGTGLELSRLTKSPVGKTSPLSILQRSVTGVFGSFHPRNSVLYRKWESDDGKTYSWQLILPKTRVSTVLKELYGSPIGGHFGVMKTLQKFCERFYWNNVQSDVEKCCRIHDPCASRKGPRKRTRGRLQLYNVEAPFERIAFDILGLLPRLSDGNNNILVVMDYFTKWPEAYPIPDQEASTVALDLSIRGPSITALRSREKLRFCSLQGTTSGVHETTGYSSSQMLFGRDLRLPADLLFSRPPDAPLAPEEYIEKLQARMEEIHHLARKRIGLASEKMKTRYDARATGHDFHECDKVWF